MSAPGRPSGATRRETAASLEFMMLTTATLGIFVYGVYSAAWAVVDVIRGARLDMWAELGLMFFGLLLALSAAFVRVRLPGGLAFAIGAMLGLQALAVHNAVHLETGLSPQIGRAMLSAALVALAAASGRLDDADTPSRDRR